MPASKPDSIILTFRSVAYSSIVIDLFFQDYFIAFKNACPNVTLELYATDRKVNIIESGFDAGIRYSQDVPNVTSD